MKNFRHCVPAGVIPVNAGDRRPLIYHAPGFGGGTSMLGIFPKVTPCNIGSIITEPREWFCF